MYSSPFQSLCLSCCVCKCAHTSRFVHAARLQPRVSGRHRIGKQLQTFCAITLRSASENLPAQHRPPSDVCSAKRGTKHELLASTLPIHLMNPSHGAEALTPVQLDMWQCVCLSLITKNWRMYLFIRMRATVYSFKKQSNV
ncbi:hypothetical protein OE88DRAFT_413213 [Heliocybe sulcata]|uniref:Uncharacterized protein n=1 Tax=Heliocybe sulcata TaxID=5364 RepID=A0A5C3MW18_9AGAM|nr:hypothetical protein OE88DRAFT_413213 [Heliocybe sulcata]